MAFCADTFELLESALDGFLSDLSQNQSATYLHDTAARSRKEFSAEAPYRLLMVLELSSDGLSGLEQQVQKLVRQLKDTPPDDHWQSGNLFFGGPRKPGKLAFIFPGQGSQYVNMGRDLVCAFPQAMALIDFANEQFGNGRTLSEYIFPRPVKGRKALQELETRLRSTDIAQPAIGAISIGMLQILDSFGITADATCGHSYGELPALLAAGRIDLTTLMRLSIARGALMAAAGSASGKDNGAMLAVKAPLDKIDELIAQSGLTEVILANRNSPLQGVLSGPTEAILKAEKLCKEQKFRAIKLPVAAAFHSKMLADAQKPFSDLLDGVPFTESSIPVFSNSSAQPYPDAPDQARALLSDQILSPVRFVEQIRNLYDHGVDTFVEVGPKTVLSGLVKAIQKGQRSFSIAIDGSAGKKFGVADLARALSHIASLGHAVDLGHWGSTPNSPTPKRKQKMSIMLSGANYRSTKAPKNNAPASNLSDQTAARKRVSHEYSEDDSNTMTPTPTHPTISDQPTNNCADQTTDNHSVAGADGDEFKNKIVPSDLPPSPSAHHHPYALQTIRETLKSMQDLQRQTTEAHKLFLQTQTEASRTLRQMLAHTQSLMGLAPQPDAATQHHTDSGIASTQNVGNDQVDRTAPPHTQAQRIDDIAEDNHFQSVPATLPEPPNIPVPEKDPLAQPLSATAATKSKNDLSQATIQQHLLAVVAELTGYPEETLALDMHIESDLGIDSIKRVEILSTLEERLPLLPPIAPETMGSIQTLGQIVDYLDTAGKDEIASQPFANNAGAAIEPGPAQVTDNRSIEKTLLSVVSDLTGYPTETLNLDMEIEADLGIDSIKRVEILSTVEEQMPTLPQVAPEIMGSLKTLRQITDYLANEAQRQPTDTQTVKLSEEDHLDVSAAKTDLSLKSPAEHLSAPPQRCSITLNKIPFSPGPELNLDSNHKVLITDNHTPLINAMENALAAKGLATERISWQALSSTATQPIALAPCCGLILIPQPEWGRTLSDDDFLKQGFALCRQAASGLAAASENGGAFLASISYIDGGFGFKGEDITAPLQGGLSGLIKTAHAEWPSVICRAFDIAPAWQDVDELAKRLVKELTTPDLSNPVEIGLDPVLGNDARWIPSLEAVALKEADNAGLNLSSGDVVVITGGGRGVTAEAALALAREIRPTMVIMGRSPQPTSEPEWLTGLTGDAAIKKAIVKNEFEDGNATPKEIATLFNRYMGNRELRQNLNQLKAYCHALAYFSVDVRQAEAVNSVLNTVRSEYGDIKAIIHGAGVIEDKHICDKTSAQFARVFDTKVKGLQSLLEATASDSIMHLVLFSSVTARMGNAGQVDYAMANEVLNKTAQQLATGNPDCRTISINWGPWDGGMVGSSLKNEFKRRNIDLLPLQAGAEAMVKEMTNPTTPGHAEVVIGTVLTPLQHQSTTDASQPQKRAMQKSPPTFSTTFSREISLADYPILGDHRLGGKPVVPLALMTEWFAHGALHANPGLQLLGLDDMRVLKGIRLETDKRLIRLLAGKTTANGRIFEVDLELRNGNNGQNEVVHTSAKAILADRLEQPPLFSLPSIAPNDRFPFTIDEIYEKILFHGEQLRGISKIMGLSDQIMIARIQPAPAPNTWIKEPLRSHWIADPLVLDCAFQMATIWCHEKVGVVSLPSYSSAYRQYTPRFPREEITVVLQVKEVSRHKMVGDFTFVSTDQTVVATLTGYEAVMDASLFRAFKPQNAA